MPKETEVVENRQKQSAASKRATFEMFKNKPRAEREVEFELGDETVSMLFRAIGAKEYDKMIAKYPPTTDQKANGATYNIDTFGPALLAQVCVEPAMAADEWKEIWNSPDWNRGEIVQMFLIATELCNRGFDIPFNEND